MAKKKYKIKWDDEKDGMVYGISIVDSPANKMQTIELQDIKKVEVPVKLKDEKKKQLAGIVLIPGQIIERYSEELGEYQIEFGEEEIRKLAENFFKGDYHKNTWYNHDRDKKVEGSTVVQSWIVEDVKNDKANALGFKDLVKGTWCVIMQLSDKAWDKYIETGKVGGFSIDSVMSMVEELELKEESTKNKNNKISMKDEIKKAFLELFTLNSEVEKKADVKLEDEKKEEEVKPETMEDEKKEEMSPEQVMEKLFKMIDEDEEILAKVKAKYSDKEKEEEAVEMAEKLKKEVTELKAKLDKTPSEGREKAGAKIEMNSKPKSRFEAIQAVIDMAESQNKQ